MDNKKTIILFDLDGTLLDSTNAIITTFFYAFEKMKFTFKGKDEDIKSLIGYPLEIMFYKLGVPQKDVFNFVEAYSLRYREISKKQTNLLENAKEAIILASSFARLSIVTTKRREPTISLLEYLNIKDYFEIITGRDCIENPKPNPEPILHTLKKMNFYEKNNVWMVGDTKLDLIAALDAKINSVGVLCGYGEENELKKYSKNIVKNSLEAVKLINNLTK